MYIYKYVYVAASYYISANTYIGDFWQVLASPANFVPPQTSLNLPQINQAKSVELFSSFSETNEQRQVDVLLILRKN